MLRKNYLLKVPVILAAQFLLVAPKVFAQNETKTEQLEWHTDLMKVHDLSEKSKKPIFAFFTGSDWCGWCIKLQQNVFSKPEFIAWAKKNVILLELDFPRNKQLSPELTQQNNSLQQAFNVTGYPAVWIFKTIKNNKEKKFTMDTYGSLGYPVGAEPGKEEVKFLEDANKLLESKTKK
ncbi:MAG TPA: thioredoxin family protein [Bacteroidia bacterium]|jgi:thiol-disulfide isomerase/thioredoxin|nr:thioredoxin family protein [Bacteroidia bacterium]